MNRRILFCSVVLLFALSNGCKDTEKDKDVVVEYLDIDKQVLNFNEKEGYGFFGISSNANWTITSSDTSDPWLIFSHDAGIGNDIVKISALANLATSSRTATVTVTSEGGISKRVYVAQGELELVVTAPSAAFIGRNITLNGANLFLIDEVWFGEAKGVIAENRTDVSMTVAIPATAERGEVELKVVYDGLNKEMVVGTINLFTPEEVEPHLDIPANFKLVGENVEFPCTFPNEVVELWFGDVKCIIKSAENETLTVTIPESITQSVSELKVVYDGGAKAKTVGKFSIAFDAGDFYLWKNVTLFAQDYEGVDEKVFCFETGMMTTICWVYEHEILYNKNFPGNPIGTDGQQPRGYHYLMLRGEANRLRLINPNANLYTDVYNCNGISPFLTNYGVPPVRFLRIDKDPYGQNQAYPETHGGNTTHTPAERQIECYNTVKSGHLTWSQWLAASEEFSNPDTRPKWHAVTAAPDYLIQSYYYLSSDMCIYFDNFASGINPAGGTPGGGIYWYNLEQLKEGGKESFHRGVVLWTAPMRGNLDIWNNENRHMTGALELVNWTGNQGAGATTGSMTVNIMRRKTWDESQYSLDPIYP